MYIYREGKSFGKAGGSGDAVLFFVLWAIKEKGTFRGVWEFASEGSYHSVLEGYRRDCVLLCMARSVVRSEMESDFFFRFVC